MSARSERGISLQDDFDPIRREFLKNMGIVLGVGTTFPALLACRPGGVAEVSDAHAIADILQGRETENKLPLRIFPISVQRSPAKPETEIKAKEGHEWFYITFGFYNRSDKDIEMDTFGIPMNSPLIKGRININGANYYRDDVDSTLALSHVMLPPDFGFTQVNGETHSIGFELPKGARVEKVDMPEFGEMDLTKVVDPKNLKFPANRIDSEFEEFRGFTHEFPGLGTVEIGSMRKIGTEVVKFGWADRQTGDFDVYELPYNADFTQGLGRPGVISRRFRFEIFDSTGGAWISKPGSGSDYGFSASGGGQRRGKEGTIKIYLPTGFKSGKLVVYGSINKIFNLRLV